MSSSTCPTGRTRHGDRISAHLARSRTVSGAQQVGDPYRCVDCDGWHVPIALPVQRSAPVEAPTPYFA